MDILKNENQKYYDEVGKILEKNGLLVQGFINYFGKSEEDYIKSVFDKVTFHVMHMREEVSLLIIEQQKIEMIFVQDNIISELTSLLCVDKEKLLFYFQKSKSGFTWDAFLELPFLHYQTMSKEEKKNMTKTFYDVDDFNVELDKKNVTTAEKLSYVKPMFQKLFSEYEKKLSVYRVMQPGTQKNEVFSILKSYQTQSRNSIQELMHLLHNKRNSDDVKYSGGLEISNPISNNICVAVHAPLKTWIHEFGHVVFESFWANVIDFSDCLNPTFQSIETQGIFSSSEIMVLEVFNDYFAFQILKSLSSSQLSNWIYGKDANSYGSEFFPIIEMFYETIEHLLNYASIHNQSNLVKQVVGTNNFSQYTALFQEEMSPELLIKAKCIVSNMVLYATNYEPNYYDTVRNYISELESGGQKVRVLHPSMEKLKMDEKVIRSTINNL